MRGLILAPALVLLACNGGSDGAESAAKSEAVTVNYGALGSHIGTRVRLTSWVLGEGEAYRGKGETDEYYHVFIPSPEIDWQAFFEDYKRCEALVQELTGDDDSPAASHQTNEYAALQTQHGLWRGLILGIEKDAKHHSWGVMRRNVLGMEFDNIPEGPLVLLLPSRAQLREAAEALMFRWNLIAGSAELQVTGTVISTSDMSQGGETIGGGFQATIRSKPYLIQVDSIKILRTAWDMLGDGPTTATTEGPDDPEVQ